METSSTVGEVAAALAKAQAGLGKLVKSTKVDVPTKTGAGYSYTYATLADALAACRSALSEQGIAVVQEAMTPKEDRGVEVSTTLLHSSGEWLRMQALFMPVAGGAQDIGSAITYARRYQLLAAVGLAPEDDDGAAAQAATPKQSPRAQPAQPSKLELLQQAVEDKVQAYAEAYEVTLAVAWSDACSAAGFPRLGGDKGPWGCGFADLGKINAELKKALAAPPPTTEPEEQAP